MDRHIDDGFDYVITVCDDANETCSFFPNAKQRLHWSLPDPSKATGSAEEQRAAYRKVRDDPARRIDRELLSPQSQR